MEPAARMTSFFAITARVVAVSVRLTMFTPMALFPFVLTLVTKLLTASFRLSRSLAGSQYAFRAEDRVTLTRSMFVGTH